MHHSLSSHQLSSLEIIYDAYDRVYDIASHRWNSDGFFHQPTRTSGLLGHYVRRLDAFKERDPALITYAEYVAHSLPLQTAFDEILPMVYGYSEPPVTIRDIMTGYKPEYRHLTPYQRVMAVFAIIEKHFPRADYRTPAHSLRHRRRSTHQRKEGAPSPPAAYINRRPQRRSSWLPYKD